MADNYVEALEKKIAELAGIPLEAIRKKKKKKNMNEGDAIKDSTDFINNIVVAKQANASASKVNPLISKIFGLVEREAKQTAGNASLPELGYAYDALQPHICADIMEIHHSKHHQGYVNNLNAANGKLTAAQDAGDNSAINALANGIVFNGGGHLNHTIFWTNMKPNPTEDVPSPAGSLADQINKDFGSFEAMKDQFCANTAAVKGSGWGWLAYDQAASKLGIYTTQNQDTVEVVHGAVPILGCDVWEHAYYLQYKNRRPAYIANFFKIVNWDNCQSRFDAAK